MQLWGLEQELHKYHETRELGAVVRENPFLKSQSHYGTVVSFKNRIAEAHVLTRN